MKFQPGRRNLYSPGLDSGNTDFGALVVLDVSIISRHGRSNSPVKRRAQYVGQWLNNPPSVEGWHQGADWLDTGTVVERVNFATQQLGDASIRTTCP